MGGGDHVHEYRVRGGVQEGPDRADECSIGEGCLPLRDAATCSSTYKRGRVLRPRKGATMTKDACDPRKK